MIREGSPYQARQLTRSELANQDIFMLAAPRTEDTVTLVDPIRLAMWLLLTFDPHCHECVERPRKLLLHNDVYFELDFWTRNREGSEMFWVTVSEKDSRQNHSGRLHHDSTLWLEAASRAGIQLTFVHETQLVRQGQRIANFFRMLPHVQAAYQLTDLAILRDRLTDLFSNCPVALSFEQVEKSLPDLNRSSVRSTLCSFVFEGRLVFEGDLSLTERTTLTWSASL